MPRPDRFGWGWTVNFAHRRSWLLFLVVLCGTLGSVVASTFFRSPTAKASLGLVIPMTTVLILAIWLGLSKDL